MKQKVLTNLRLLGYCLLFSFQLSFQQGLAAQAGAIEAETAITETEAATEIVERPELTVNIARENYDNPLIQIETSMGNMILELFPEEAPIAVASFLALAEGSKEFIDPVTGEWVTRPFFDGLIFHRVIENFMIQGGSPNGQGNGNPGFSFKDEINARSLGLDRMPVLEDNGNPHRLLGISSQNDFQEKVLGPLYQNMGITSQEELDANIDGVDERIRAMTVKESYENLGYEYTETVISRNPVRGVIAMANSGPNTNGSQFFINLIDTEWLTGKHTVFGKVRGAGMDVLDAIAAVSVDDQSRPIEDVIILSVRQLQD
jgi:cyclophilin family peptidyl-prolyl cis-trans isomerase